MRRCTFHPRRLIFWRQMQGLVLAEAQRHPNIFIFKMFRTSRFDFAKFTNRDENLGDFYLIFSFY